MNTSPEIQKKILEANSRLAECRSARRKIETKNFVNTFFVLLALAGFLVLGGLLYQNRAQILAKGKALITDTLPQPVVSQSKTSSTSSECDVLSMNLEGNSLQVSIPKTGSCYTIGSEYQSAWKQTFSQANNRAAFASQIGGDQAFVETALENSLGTMRLDLRPQETTANTPSPTPTTVPQYGERDTPLALEKLVAVMTELKIGSVSGTTEEQKGQSWKLFYSSSDYLSLDLQSLPEVCLSVNKISVSLAPFEGAMSLGNGWISCQ